MRSRYSAFALGQGAYLVDTLSASHPDRALPPDLLARELARLKDSQRFLGLVVVWASDPSAPEPAEVLFHARIFQKGRDHSFAELSRFERDPDDGSWRYVSGLLVPATSLPVPPSALTRDVFLAAFAKLPATKA